MDQDLYLNVNKDNLAFMLERFGSDCLPQQEIRELVENSIQAILARKANEPESFSGQIQVCMDPNSIDEFGVAKVAFIDNGEGMSKDDLGNYLLGLYQTGRSLGSDENFGIGAKISTLQTNPAGVLYRSWQNGVGFEAILGKRPDGRYGFLKPVEKIDNSLMPDLIKESNQTGTIVTLLGYDLNKTDTLESPIDFAGKKANWLAWVLNHRYYDFPAGITINTSTTKSKKPKNWVEVKGVKDFINRYSKASGSIDLGDLIIDWALLKHNRTYKNEKNIYDSGAKIGAVYGNELFDYSTSGAMHRIQQNCGIPFGANEIALFFRPKEASMNQTRSALLIDSNSLPWDEWYRLFRQNMPKAIKDHLALKSKQTGASDKISNRILRTFNSYRNAHKLERSSTGKKIAGQPLTSINNNSFAGNSPVPVGSSSASPAGTDTITSPGLSSGTKPHMNGSLLGPGTTVKARRKKLVFTEEELPDHSWARDSQIGFNGYFIRYLKETNQILLNEDFVLYKEVVDKWAAVTEPEYKERIIKSVQRHFAIQAVEVIMQIQSLEGLDGWESDKVDALLADEMALSIAATQRILMDHSLSQALSSIPKKKVDK